MAGEAIFIGYRRDDTADVAGRIYDAMALRFGKQRIFKDVDNIGPGVDFGDYIKSVLPRCRVALVLIGPHWLDSKDESGGRRIDDEHDWVRIEIETALATPGLLVVPVLVNGARMPRAEEVPESLKPLLRRNAAIIRRDPDFHDDVERLATALRASVNTGVLDLSKIGGKAAGPAPTAAPRKSNMPLLIGGAVAAIVLVAIGFGASRYLPTQHADTVEEQDAEPAAEPVPQLQTFPAWPADAALPEDGTLPEMVRVPERSFEVGRYEVTFAQWDACVAAGGCNGYRPGDEGWGRGNRPVINVSWNDAQAYVRWLSQRTGQRYRLLTLAEWEIAARAGTTTNFSWGDQDPVCDQNARNGANFRACTDDRTRPVGSFQPNAFGLYDVHGNVSEWLEDCLESGSACSNRKVRGGSWYADPQYLRSASQSANDATIPGNNLGFRVARTLN
jgi:formylglycine-generating enzyme required for sulfatase activity